MTDTGGLLLVHAHPDDETIVTGGTIAHYCRRGVPVTVVTCTLGEEGEIIGDQWAQLASAQADQLGGYRIGELSRALGELGVAQPVFLGGAGRWRDSGMAGTVAAPRLGEAAKHPRAFVNSGPAAVDALVELMLRLQPQVLVGYDPYGGYGHPDHIRAHEITMAAVDVAGEQGWQLPKVYWIVDEFSGTARESVTTVVEVSDVLPAKVAALRAHATQVAVTPHGREFALSNGIALPVPSREYFTLVRGTLGPVSADGLEHDLFAGLQH